MLPGPGQRKRDYGEPDMKIRTQSETESEALVTLILCLSRGTERDRKTLHTLCLVAVSGTKFVTLLWELESALTSYSKLSKSSQNLFTSLLGSTMT